MKENWSTSQFPCNKVWNRDFQLVKVGTDFSYKSVLQWSLESSRFQDGVMPIDCSPKLLFLSKSHSKRHHLCELLWFIWIINVASFRIILMKLRFAEDISKEAAEFGLGETRYCAILLISAIVLQLLVIGIPGVILSSTSPLEGLCHLFWFQSNMHLLWFSCKRSFMVERAWPWPYVYGVLLLTCTENTR